MFTIFIQMKIFGKTGGGVMLNVDLLIGLIVVICVYFAGLIKYGATVINKIDLMQVN